ncbi:hypothetical protein QJQ45_010917 [Haematococcus lacustris]|nr:hypothetical protein QJQ45_010917 [Haematococcus lacustris]
MHHWLHRWRSPFVPSCTVPSRRFFVDARSLGQHATHLLQRLGSQGAGAAGRRNLRERKVSQRMAVVDDSARQLAVQSRLDALEADNEVVEDALAAAGSEDEEFQLAGQEEEEEEGEATGTFAATGLVQGSDSAQAWKRELLPLPLPLLTPWLLQSSPASQLHVLWLLLLPAETEVAVSGKRKRSSKKAAAASAGPKRKTRGMAGAAGPGGTRGPRTFARLLEEALLSNAFPEGTPSYLTAAADPPAIAAPRKFCSVCGNNSA